MHLPSVAYLSKSLLANIIAGTIEILVKSTRFYPYFEYLPCYTIMNYLIHAHIIYK